jgi:hypothetical protein
MTMMSTAVSGLGSESAAVSFDSPRPGLVLKASGVVPPASGAVQVEQCSYLSVLPSGGFWAPASIQGFGDILSSCWQWVTSAHEQDPATPPLVGVIRMSHVVGRRRLEPAPLDDDDFV